MKKDLVKEILKEASKIDAQIMRLRMRSNSFKRAANMILGKKHLGRPVKEK